MRLLVCVSGLQPCHLCDDSRSSDSDAAEQQHGHQRGLGKHSGSSQPLAAPAENQHLLTHLLSADGASGFPGGREQDWTGLVSVDLGGLRPGWSPAASWDLPPALEGQPCQELLYSTSEKLPVAG